MKNFEYALIIDDDADLCNLLKDILKDIISFCNSGAMLILVRQFVKINIHPWNHEEPLLKRLCSEQVL